MNQKTDITNNEILNRLRENIEKKNDSDSTVVLDNKGLVSSPENLLNELKSRMGGELTAGTESVDREEDYDIRGFELEESEDLAPVEEFSEETLEAECVVQDDENTIESLPLQPIIGANAPDEEDLPWETDAEDDAEDNTEVQIEEAPRFSPIAEHCEAAENNSESDTDAAKEAVRKQIEEFVEKTIDPEAEFDYFAELDRKLERAAESACEMPVIEPCAPAEPNQESLASETQNNIERQCAESDVQNDAFENSDPAVTSFFFNSLPSDNETIAQNLENKAQKLDNTDISLLLALGKKQELEETIGFVKVREAKNNFQDPAEDEVFENYVFAYNGEEFTAPEQIGSIKKRYRKEKRKLGQKLFGVIILAFLLLVSEHAPLLGGALPGGLAFLNAPLQYRLANCFLLLLLSLISLREIAEGIRGFLLMRPNRYSPIAVLTVLNIVYSLSSIFFAESLQVISYNFLISVYWAVSTIADLIRLAKESLTFDIVSNTSEKFSLEKAEYSAQYVREEKVLQENNLLVEKVNFVGKYFKRTARRSAYNVEYFVELLVSIVLAFLAAIFSATTQGSLSYSVNAFMFVLAVGMPMQYLLGNYAFSKLSKLLYRHNSAIIGENVEREYMGTSTVFLDDVEVFGSHGAAISGLRTYADANFYDILYYASAVFSRIEGPLRYVFEKSAHEIPEAKTVQLLNIYTNGIESLVDGSKKVLVGNINFMRNNGFFPKYNEEDEKKVNNGEASILYLAVSGEIWAKFYMKYTLSKRFEPFVSEMMENNTNVGIRTLDPNITEKMISLLRKDPDASISVIRPTLNDLVPVGRRSDSSIITAKNPHMISRILTLCGHVKRVNKTCVFIRINATIISISLAMIAVLLGLITKFPSVVVAIYQLLWLIPSLYVIESKIK